MRRGSVRGERLGLQLVANHKNPLFLGGQELWLCCDVQCSEMACGFVTVHHTLSMPSCFGWSIGVEIVRGLLFLRRSKSSGG